VAEDDKALVAAPEELAGRAAHAEVEPLPDPRACPNFDRLAVIYRWMELATFGPWLHRTRCAFLNRLADRRRALVIGDGDGRFAAQLLRAHPAIAIDAVDASPAMLRALVRRARFHAARVAPYVADARRWQPVAKTYDLVVTHFFLDCLTTDEVWRLAETVRGAVAEGSLWVVSEFAIPRNRFGKFVARPLVAALYFAFGALTGLRIRRLPDYAAALRGAGFALVNRRTWLSGLLTSELWTVSSGSALARDPDARERHERHPQGPKPASHSGDFGATEAVP